MLGFVAAVLLLDSVQGLSNDSMIEARLSREIAIAASRSEASAGASAGAIRNEVTSAAQQTIISSGLRPRLVLAALNQVVTGCAHEPRRSALTCPRTQTAVDALRDLMAVVARLADQDVSPGAADFSVGGPATIAPPSNPGGGGGSEYRTPG